MRARGLVRFVATAQMAVLAFALIAPSGAAAATLGFTLAAPSVSTVQYSDFVTFSGAYTCVNDATSNCPTTATSRVATFSLRPSGGSSFTNVASVSSSIVFTTDPAGCATVCSVPFQVVWRAGRAGSLPIPPGLYDLRLTTTIATGELMSPAALTITREDTATTYTGAMSGLGGTALALNAAVVDLDRGVGTGNGIISPDSNLGGAGMVTFALYDATNTSLVAGPVSATLLSSGLTINGSTLTPPLAGGMFQLRTTYAGNSFYVTSSDLDAITVAPANTPPSLVLPGGTVVAEATSPAGAAVSYAVSATDPEDDPDPTPACSPVSGTTFALGDTTVSCTVTDGNGATTTGSFTVRVLDTIVPHVAVGTSEAVGGTGWYNAASNDDIAGVTVAVSDGDLVGVVSLVCTDNGVDVGALAAGGDSFVLGDGSHAVSCTATDAAGNSAAAGASFDVDQTAPMVSGALTPAADATGWWNLVTGAPTVSWTCGDGGSGILSCSSPSTFGEGADQSAVGTATDVAGNIATSSVSGVDVDLTPPTAITLTGTSLADGAVYDFGSVPGTPTGCTAVDPVSGLSSCLLGGSYGTGVGSWTVTAIATDVAGNTSSGAVSYAVIPWTLSGFDKPIDMTAPNDLRAGGSANLKFTVDAGSTDLSTLAVVAGIDQQLIACPQATRGPNGHTGGTQAALRRTGASVSIRWQAPNQPGTCWLVTVRTADGSSLSAIFKLR